MTPRTRPCDASVARGRLRKALQFSEAFRAVWDLADQPDDVADACATLAVHAGIAASDVITCRALGTHAIGSNHVEAVAILASVDKGLSRSLASLLALKSKAGYSHAAVTRTDLMRAERAMEALVRAARI